MRSLNFIQKTDKFKHLCHRLHTMLTCLQNVARYMFIKVCDFYQWMVVRLEATRRSKHRQWLKPDFNICKHNNHWKPLDRSLCDYWLIWVFLSVCLFIGWLDCWQDYTKNIHDISIKLGNPSNYWCRSHKVSQLAMLREKTVWLRETH